MTYCPLLVKIHNFYEVMSQNLVNLIITVSNLFTMLSTKMSFPSSNIVYIEILIQELLPLVHEMLSLFARFTL